jgi:CHAD domain-containing protein
MKLARPVYGRFHADAVRRAFAEAMKATGDLRDEEVLEETLGALVLQHDAFLTFRRRRGLRERRLRRAMVTNVRNGVLTHALAMLRALTILPVDPKNDKSLAKFARRVVAKAEAEVHRQKSAPTDDVSLLHELRIAYKELRYTVELFEPALPPETVAIVKAAAKMQKRLGEVHDLDVAILTVARARVMPLAARKAALGELEIARDAKVQKYIEEKTPAAAIASRAPASSE